MEFILNILQSIDIPLWIRNKKNQIIFINDSLQKKFDINIDDINSNLEKSESKELKSLYKMMIMPKFNSSFTYEIKDKIYKPLILFCDDKSKNEVAILIDITDVSLKSNNQQVNMLKSVIDNIPELIFYKDDKLRYVSINKEFKKFYEKIGVKDIIGKTDLEFSIDSNFTRACKEHDDIVLKTKETLYSEEEFLIPGKDEFCTINSVKTPIIGEDGNVLGLIGVARDITEQKKLEKKLRYLSYTDRLTNLYNRAYFDEKVSEFIENKKFPIGVVIGYVNGLKIVNDTLGHLDGDRLLKEMSSVLKEVCGDNGLVFRWGGDEFITLIPNSTEKDCIEFIEKVNNLCDKKIYDNFKLSISQGHSMINEHTNLDDALREAEDKVYRQKILDNKSVRVSILNTLRESLEEKNLETQEHTKRVAKYSVKVGKALGLNDEILEKLALVGELHDIGKIGIPEHILLKPEKLTNDEYEIMKTHAEKGYRLALLLPELSYIARDILTHHERWDGRGYPLGLKGEEIPLVARIVSVIDSFDAMTNDRIHERRISKYKAIKEIKACSGKQFDPKIVEVFSNIIENEL